MRMIAQLTNLATHSLTLSMIERQVLNACMFPLQG
jgi:hypothetical protein